jgi:hypothetical protein
MRWQRGVLVAGLIVAAAGVALMVAYLHRHQVCIAPDRAAISAAHPAPSTCSLTDVLFYLGMGATALGAVVIVGATAVRHRRR